MKDTNIFIARHGETEYNRIKRIQGRGIDEPLNATGRAQARAIAGELQDKRVDHIFSSSLKRSNETAEIIGAELIVNVESFSELDEMDFGSIEGRPINEIRKNLDELHHRWKGGNTAFAIEQGESPDGVLERPAKRSDVRCFQDIEWVCSMP